MLMEQFSAHQNLSTFNNQNAYKPLGLLFKAKKHLKLKKNNEIFFILFILVLGLFLGFYEVITFVKISPYENTTKIQRKLMHENFASTGQDCKIFLAYNLNSLKQDQYQRWYGKVGTDIKGTKYLPGHFIEQHVALNGKCTDYQIKNNKTVFATYQEVLKAIKFQTVQCDFSQATHFTYDQHNVIAAPSDYIKGIDCSKPQLNNYQFFPKFFIQFKRTVANSAPTQDQYMRSQKTTVWTFYPQRS